MTERTELSIYDPESGTVWEIRTGPLKALPENIESTSIGLVGRLEVTIYTLGHHELGVGSYLKHVSAILLPPSPFHDARDQRNAVRGVGENAQAVTSRLQRPYMVNLGRSIRQGSQ